MMFDIRTTPLKQGEKPWVWGIPSEKQCTWWVYYRAFQVFGAYPCYNDRANKVSGYNCGKKWLDNFREPYKPYYFDEHPNIEFKQGDIIVFDGNYGHVVFIERVDDFNSCFISQYNMIAPLEFSNDEWYRGGILKGNPYNTGKPIGLLRCEKKEVYPVERNEYRDQIYSSEPTLRVRLAPNLEGEYYCNMKNGYYNVLSISYADNYTWYEIEKGKYCANIGTTFYEAKNEDVDKLQKELDRKNNGIDEAIEILKGVR